MDQVSLPSELTNKSDKMEYMKQQFPRFWTSCNDDSDRQETNEVSPSTDCYSLLSCFQCSAERGNPGRAQQIAWGEEAELSIGVARCRTEDLTGELQGERLWRTTEGPLKYLGDYWSGHGCEETTPVWGEKENIQKDYRNVSITHTGPGIVCAPNSQTRKKP